MFGRRASTPDLPPPWSTAAFAALCDGCGRCLPACPTDILVKGARNVPTVDFRRGVCTFCAACAQSCPTGALRQTEADGAARAPWHAAATIAARCLSLQGTACRICEDQCEPGAVRFRLMTGGRALPIVDGERCSGCGACVAPCPAGAIAVLAS